MSDETRTVTVEDIEGAIREIAPVVGGELQAGGIKHHVGLAHAIFAALPTSTEGLHSLLWPPHPGNGYMSSALCSCGEFQWDHDTASALFNEMRLVLRDWTEHVRLASLSPSPTEDPA